MTGIIHNVLGEIAHEKPGHTCVLIQYFPAVIPGKSLLAAVVHLQNPHGHAVFHNLDQMPSEAVDSPVNLLLLVLSLDIFRQL